MSNHTRQASSPAAERQRRYRDRQRRHGTGDHSICVAGKCSSVEPAPAGMEVGDAPEDVTGDVTPVPEKCVTKLPPPAGLGSRGAALWDQMSGLGYGPGHLVLLAEACRNADTLEWLSGQMQPGSDLLQLVRVETEGDEATEVRVVVNGLLAERRQQQQVFRLAIAELRLTGRVSTAAKPGTAGDVPGSEGSAAGDDVADLTAWIDAARRAASEG